MQRFNRRVAIGTLALALVALPLVADAATVTGAEATQELAAASEAGENCRGSIMMSCWHWHYDPDTGQSSGYLCYVYKSGYHPYNAPTGCIHV